MTRINTNVSSLLAQKTLGRSNVDLQTSLTRLSTGLRINSGKDDPAGLIASENLRRDITSINRAIGNTERANQLIATADSALGQISNLLNDIRGLVVEAANTGVLSDEQIAANQLQVDSSLEALDRIAQVTTFQGRKLLDGSLDFQIAYSTGGSSVLDLDIDQANLGTAGAVDVNVLITSAATQALITNTGFGASAATQASGNVTRTFTPGTISIAATAGGAADGIVGNQTDVIFQAATDIAHASGSLNLANTVGTISVNAVAGGAAQGATGNGTDVQLLAALDRAQASGTVSLTNSSGSLTIGAQAGGAADGAVGNTTDVVFQAAGTIAQASGTLTLTNGAFDIAAVAGGAADGVVGNTTTINLTISAAATGTTYNAGTNTIEVNVNTGDIGTYTVNDLATDIGALADFNTSNVVTGAGLIDAADETDGTPAPYDVLTGGNNGTTTATYNAGTNTLTVGVALGATLTSIAGVIDGTADFTATAASGGANAFDITDYGTSADPLTGGDDGTTSASYNAGTNTITAYLAVGTTVTQLAAAINGLADFNASATAGGANVFDDADIGPINGPLTGGSDGTTTAAYASNTITANVALNSTVGQVAAAIDGLAAFSASAVTGSGNTFNPLDYGSVLNPLTGGANGGASDVLASDLVVKIAGSTGAEVFTFESGATLAQVVSAVNLVSDATSVEAADNGGVLELRSTGYGSAAIVDVEVLEEGTGGNFETGLSTTRDEGTDVVATVNGVTGNGRGNTISINTTTLDLSLTIADGSNTAISFSINGGGAVFQLGPQVVSNQQARIGIASVSTGELGGINGRLYQLRSGNDSDLASDPNTATLIVDSAINKITSLRGRLGAFQRTTLETNIASLSDTVTNLVEAESSIRDADFAAESARLTRAQILVQSGTQVLAIANQNPQNVLALLRG